jgi:hypothetical protein
MGSQRLLVLLEVSIFALESHHRLFEDILGGKTQEVRTVKLELRGTE